jgi:hypothetical protein
MGGFQGYEDQKKEWYGLGAVLELSSVRCHPARFAANLYPTYRKPFDLISMLVPHYTEGPIRVDLQPKVDCQQREIWQPCQQPNLSPRRVFERYRFHPGKTLGSMFGSNLASEISLFLC